jgi:Domain of unknown function (DUF4276)
MATTFTQVVILVEGQTEEAFVKELLCPYLQHSGVWIEPKIIVTKIVKSGANFKGGSVSFGKAQRDLTILLKDKSIYVTTFFDFYGLKNDFPSFTDMPNREHSIYTRIKFLEKACEKAINNARFKAYFQPYEFEALLFASIDGFKNNFPSDTDFIKGIERIQIAYPNPEKINDQPTTAPSKRIVQLKANYEKIFHGNMIALENGMDVLIEKCPHFAEWVNWLKGLKPLM